jgi:O-antigen biosynthesis protein
VKLRSFQDWIWQKKTSIQKRLIAWEDRLGLYPYWMWIKTVEQPQLRKKLKGCRVDLASAPQIGFVITEDQFDQTAFEKTIRSLNQFSSLRWVLSILVPEHSPLHGAGWFQNIISSNPHLQVIHCVATSCLGDWVEYAPRLTGDWLVPLTAGDQLSSAWASLFCYAVEQNQSAEIIYWDEDQLAGREVRKYPFFKPDWSPALLYSLNYLETAGYKRELVLRCYPNSSSQHPGWIFQVTGCAQRIEHIPSVLQHRAAPSTSLPRQKTDNHAEVVRAALGAKKCKDFHVVVNSEGNIRAVWTVDNPKVSVIIPTKNNLDYIQRCLSSLLEKTVYPDFEILLIDDHSNDSAVLDYYQKIQSSEDRVRIYPNETAFNYSRVNNHGAQLAAGSLLLFLNNDTEILDGDWLNEMVRWAQTPGTGMVGAKLLYPDGGIQHAGIVFGMTGHAYHLYAGIQAHGSWAFLSPAMYRNVSAVTGACMLVRKDVFEQVGGFDENLKLIFNDVELCLKVRQAGYHIVYTPAASLIHYEGRSRSRFNPPDDIRLGAEVLMNEIKRGDRYYNPNLSLAVGWPTLRRWYEPEASVRLQEIVQHSVDMKQA